MEDEIGLPRGAFTKLDDEEDEIFYEPPRLVYHIDDSAVAALTALLQAKLGREQLSRADWIALGATARSS